jgi:multidrug efflux pump subunit AcrB
LNLKLALFPDIRFPVVVVTASTNQIDVAKNEREVTDRSKRRWRASAG